MCSRAGGRWAGALLVLSLLALPGAADAEGAVAEGQILRIEGPEVYVDLGRRRGGVPGREVSLFRVLRVPDPKTGDTLEDRFFVASGTIAEAGEQLARLEVEPSVATLLSLGDRVTLGPRPPAPAPAPAEALPLVAVATPAVPLGAPVTEAPPRLECPPPPPERPSLGPDGQAFRRAFAAAAEGDLTRRELAWQAFLREHPDSDLAGPAQRELESLKVLRGQLSEVRHRIEAPAGETLARAAPVATEGEPVPVSLTVDRPEKVSGALLHYRATGEEELKLARMHPIGASTYVAEIPASEVRTPSMDWQVSLQLEGDEVDTAVGERGSTRLAVHKAPIAPDRSGRSSVRLAYEYVDFYRFENADRYSHFTADFLYRIRARAGSGEGALVFHSIRAGYGGYHGRGGDTQAIEAADGDPTTDFEDVTEVVGFNFGYTELEFHFSPYVGMIARGLVGIDRGGMAGGGQFRLRLGREEGTNLQLGALSIGGLGETYLLQLSWDTVPRMPMSGRVEVTTHPVVESDIGVRLIYEARYEFTPWFELGGQVGYGLRNINHGGLSAGVSTVFNW
ncbi:MAG: hypothetical protein P1V51_13485 [Deltaproteobacteria bacterium]|nr:hypothetical protein [Deltaproteobacteria bacterium]